MKCAVALFCFAVSVSQCVAQDPKIQVPITNPGDRYDLIGELGAKLGETMTVEGTVVEGPFKGYEGGPNLLVKIINGKATQHPIQIPLEPYFGAFGEADYTGKALPKMESDSTYSLRAYETGAFIGVPSAAYKEAGLIVQTTGFYFRNALRVISGKKIDAIVWHPAQFVDRNALLSGIARNENHIPTIQGSGWRIILVGTNQWTNQQLGKQAEVFGIIRATSAQDTFRVERGRARLTNLEDQLGQSVALRGTARSGNNHWWFNYRGTDLYVENMDQLPNWSAANHWRPIEITGILERASRTDREQKMYYIVRRPKWTPASKLLTPELPSSEPLGD